LNKPDGQKAKAYEREIAELQSDLERTKEQAEITDSISGGKGALQYHYSK